MDEELKDETQVTTPETTQTTNTEEAPAEVTPEAEAEKVEDEPERVDA